MPKTHRYICASVSGAFALFLLVFCLHFKTPSAVIPCIILIQPAVWLILRHKSLITFALSFIPSTVLWFEICLILEGRPERCIHIIPTITFVAVFLLSLLKTGSRKTTQLWLGCGLLFVNACLIAARLCHIGI